MTIKLQKENRFITVPKKFILEELPEAKEKYIKLYLTILACEGDITHLDLDRLGITDTEMYHILKYWSDRGYLIITQDADGYTVDIPSTPTAKEDTHRGNEVVNETKQLIHKVQQAVGKPIGKQELDSIFFIKEDLGFSNDLILYLAEYAGPDKFKSAYIEKVATSWYESGIQSVEDAKTHKRYEQYVYDTMKILENGRYPASIEADMITKWYKEWEMDPDVIANACTKAVTNAHGNRITYADHILSKWHENGIKDMSQVKDEQDKHEKELKIRYKGKGAEKWFGFNQRDYGDMEALEEEFQMRSLKQADSLPDIEDNKKNE